MSDDETHIGRSAVLLDGRCIDAYDFNMTLSDDERLAMMQWFHHHGFDAVRVRFVRYEEGHLTLGIIREEPRLWIDEVEVIPMTTFPWPVTARLRLQPLRR